MTTTDSTATEGLFSPEAHTAVAKAAKGRHALYVPSVLEQAAELLTDLWATGKRHGVDPGDWAAVAGLADACVDVTSRQYGSAPDPERTGEQVVALCHELIEALASAEIGLSARPGPRKNMALVDRLPETPRVGHHGGDLVVGIYSNSGWDISMNASGAAVVSIAAPATTAGATEVAALVQAVARGELGNIFRR
jgi:hypothetical protein